MKHRITIGVICLARKTFDYNAAGSLFEGIKNDLLKIENTVLEIIPDLVMELEDAQRSALILASKNIDGIVCISGTFHLGHLILEVFKKVQKPVLLWGLPELPYDGGKIRLNSICGVNLNASNLYKSGIRNYFVHVGNRIDENWIDALRIVSCMEQARIGIAGFRAHGFFNLGIYDLNAYKNFGVLVDHYELNEIFDMPVTEKEMSDRSKQFKQIFDVSGISSDQLEKVSSLAVKMTKFLDHNKLNALALRCWPEFAGSFGISPCAAMSLLQAEGRIIACEGDVEGALSMLAQRAVGAETPFLFDFSQVNFDENYALLWHCGVAPCNLWDGKSDCSLDSYFAGGKGVTADFVLKEGEISILRFDSTGDEYRIFLQKAKGSHMNKDLKGSYVKVTFDEPVREVMNKVVYNGIAHHASMAYGEYIKPFEIFARIKGWKIIS